MEKLVDLSQLTRVQQYSEDFSCYGKDYIFSRVSSCADLPPDNTSAWRFSGLIILLCLKGKFKLEYNLEEYEVGAKSLFVMTPDVIMRVNDKNKDDFEAYTLFVSREFMTDINIDTNVINVKHMTSVKSPILHLDDTEFEIMQRYFELLNFNAKSNSDSNTATMYTRSIARNLIASLAYQMMAFSTKHLDNEELDAKPQSRRVTYVRDFIKLVGKYHLSERSVGFYADKLFISPKYLSLIIKETTGHSAAEWIDRYVIIAAKNLLRFSGKNIQQIAYELNFSNQSSFGKYFKHLTGMSPSEFQKS